MEKINKKEFLGKLAKPRKSHLTMLECLAAAKELSFTIDKSSDGEYIRAIAQAIYKADRKPIKDKK